ncbi:MAG: hypothetical protein M1550_05745 [Deltaproteobacteria bacterium]|nr:hypothetical protein [Deltaproteobacteria bacterium]
MPARAHVVIPEDLLVRIDKAVGKRKRSRFIAEAAEEKLQRERLLSAIERAAGAWRAEDHPEWSAPGGVPGMVRRMRKEWAARGKVR